MSDNLIADFRQGTAKLLDFTDEVEKFMEYCGSLDTIGNITESDVPWPDAGNWAECVTFLRHMEGFLVSQQFLIVMAKFDTKRAELVGALLSLAKT